MHLNIFVALAAIAYLYVTGNLYPSVFGLAMVIAMDQSMLGIEEQVFRVVAIVLCSIIMYTLVYNVFSHLYDSFPKISSDDMKLFGITGLFFFVTAFRAHATIK